MENSDRLGLKVRKHKWDPGGVPRVGVSACLLGEAVRYDGGDKASDLLQTRLSTLLCWQGFCPELNAGMGVPRPTIGLYQDGDETRLKFNPGQSVELDVSKDLKPMLIEGCETFLAEAGTLDGYVFMQRSPSCALGSAPLHGSFASEQQQYLDGVFAAELKQRYAYLPLAQECDLQEPRRLDHFLSAVFACQRLRDVVSRQSFADLLKFHGRYKYLLMAHSVPAYKKLGRLLAKRNAENVAEQIESYRFDFMAAINTRSSKGGEVNALMHMMGYIKNELDADVRQGLLARMDAYRQGKIALQPIVDELHGYVKRWGSDYIQQQYYWQPHPLSQSLRAQLS
ncbi:DUF523 and DUF1722 domain-containing protein [Pseudoteredinibacter isoporae]|uniref:Uncharacterized protein YbgA (DUF1722 family)/uncharacterized protein YbbK (DUF523 family) n=1 Tax=Pseudoteredinibacter isoporae TaxID=570281 RepID=A0A7X0JV32_9GAMM|nr:DUF1722 domain-containing protein [Pseudoteredinibacter isoporae]MBB6522697.1 uncharacterized protein YbgA (DUF1722 family)/uncharacterized protein YbbK (DUF523 family) [Pseudoteredinibacter isoporae]NHO88228.1 DUF523 and DUF1722 domain-containing protein [Pseudoteredinibacter isoporae]NIB23441.1 DUF523 and DUF1722 domain-containing protein [Pseudoteredinibacter isoporae]